jgi:hypothetical protein
MANCLKCGSEDWEVTPLTGALELMRCRRCGAEETVHAFYANRPPEPGEGECWFSLSIRLPDTLTAEQVKGLRKIFRVLELMSPVAIKKSAVAGDTIELGEYPASETKALEKVVVNIGLSESFKQVIIGGKTK